MCVNAEDETMSDTKEAATCACKVIEFDGGCEVMVNPATGQKFLSLPPRLRSEIHAKHAVEGLRVFLIGSNLKFEWMSGGCVDEWMARDAQCRAGWSDHGYGFDSFKVGVMPNGDHRATWCCGVSCE